MAANRELRYSGRLALATDAVSGAHEAGEEIEAPTLDSNLIRYPVDLPARLYTLPCFPSPGIQTNFYDDLIATTGLIEPAIIAHSILFCPTLNSQSAFCRAAHQPAILRRWVVAPSELSSCTKKESNLQGLPRRGPAGADAVGNPNAGISVPGQIQAWIFFNHACDPREAIFMANVILRHRGGPARDEGK